MTNTWLETYAAQRPKARALYAEVQQLVAGGVGHDLRHSPVTPIYIDHARGSRKWDALIRRLMPAAQKIRFVGSGTEGTMLALRLARAFTGRNKLLRFEGHFS